jgi:hypothetical protein
MTGRNIVPDSGILGRDYFGVIGGPRRNRRPRPSGERKMNRVREYMSILNQDLCKTRQWLTGFSGVHFAFLACSMLFNFCGYSWFFKCSMLLCDFGNGG